MMGIALYLIFIRYDEKITVIDVLQGLGLGVTVVVEIKQSSIEAGEKHDFLLVIPDVFLTVDSDTVDGSSNGVVFLICIHVCFPVCVS